MGRMGLAWLGWIAAVAGYIRLTGGHHGFQPFLIYEAWLGVPALAGVIWLAAYPRRVVVHALRVGWLGRSPGASPGAATAAGALAGLGNACLVAGAVVTLLGLALLCGAIGDVSVIPRMLAFCLVSLFVGLFLCGAVVGPLEARARRAGLVQEPLR